MYHPRPSKNFINIRQRLFFSQPRSSHINEQTNKRRNAIRPITSSLLAPTEIQQDAPVIVGRLGHGGNVSARTARSRRAVLVSAPVTARACADAQLDWLTAEHLPVSLQRENDLHGTTAETTHARAEAHELEQVGHPVRSGCPRHTRAHHHRHHHHHYHH